MVTVRIKETNEKGDFALPLPFKIIKTMGWEKGDLLSVTRCNMTIHLTKIVEDI
jgi:hypothetical protein